MRLLRLLRRFSRRVNPKLCVCSHDLRQHSWSGRFCGLCRCSGFVTLREVR